MKLTIWYFVFTMSASLLWSCSTTRLVKAKVNLLPRSGGDVTAVSTSTDEATAWEGAKVRAEEYCFRKGEKSYEIVDEDSKYQGDQKGGFAAGMKTVGKIFGVGSKDMNDYRVKVQFRCQGAYAGNGEPFAKTMR